MGERQLKLTSHVSGRLISMRSVAIVLCLALFGLNAEAAMLHVHKGDADSDHHHRSPAAHSHEIHVEVPLDSQVKNSDENSSAVPVVLGKAIASHIYYWLAVSENVAGVEAPASSNVPQFLVTSRAHGPPAGRSCSLRAPPSSHLL